MYKYTLKQTSKILITGARAPFSLTLLRMFASQGYIVHMADSTHLPLSRFSKYNTKFHHLPKACDSRYTDELQKIITSESIDLLIPTCEEILHLSKSLKKLSKYCEVFSSTHEELLALHNKYSFIEICQSLSLPVPRTTLIPHNKFLDNWKDRALESKIVIKPVFSRFGSNVYIGPPEESTNFMSQTDGQFPFVAQQFISGKQLCTYSIVRDGEINLHTAYYSRDTFGKGASVSFVHVEHEEALAFVRTLCQKINFTGQIGIDFIENNDGIFAIEANPRTTCGITLFQDDPEQVVDIFRTSNSTRSLSPNVQNEYGLKIALFALFFKQKNFSTTYLKRIFHIKDIVFNKKDPLPIIGQILSLLEFTWLSLKTRTSFSQATTFDIEYNGSYED